ncbi:MBL fold metallo-hydrolase [Archangium violaceum]|uniref:MBL fold metallo-hydrolase n=1 Tax=Archangium violaceum TaxID=83451 RepID=UPI002B2F100B|nr:MBL fold metallo-hydrolase [Archangium gephyra]
MTQPTGPEASGPSVYHLRNQHWPLAQYPSDLQYEAYSAVGYDLANSMLLLGHKTTNGTRKDREWIIVDTLGSGDSAMEAIKAFKKQIYGAESNWPAKIPLRAIIYTHNHIDHTAGVRGYLAASDKPPCPSDYSGSAGPDRHFNVDKEAVLSTGAPCVAVIGQVNINSAIVNTSTVVGSIIDPRSGYMYGNFVPAAHVNSGIGPQEGTTKIRAPSVQVEPKVPPVGPGPVHPDGASSYYMPSRTFTQQLKVTAAGIHLQLIYTPSETDDEIIAFVPDMHNGKGAAPKFDKKDCQRAGLTSDHHRAAG